MKVRMVPARLTLFVTESKLCCSVNRILYCMYLAKLLCNGKRWCEHLPHVGFCSAHACMFVFSSCTLCTLCKPYLWVTRHTILPLPPFMPVAHVDITKPCTCRLHVGFIHCPHTAFQEWTHAWVRMNEAISLVLSNLYVFKHLQDGSSARRELQC